MGYINDALALPLSVFLESGSLSGSLF